MTRIVCWPNQRTKSDATMLLNWDLQRIKLTFVGFQVFECSVRFLFYDFLMVCVGHITTASTGWSCGSCDSSVFLADNGLYQKEMIPDWPSSLNKTNPVVHHGRNFKLRNRCLRLIYSFHSIAESFIRRRSEKLSLRFRVRVMCRLSSWPPLDTETMFSPCG